MGWVAGILTAGWFAAIGWYLNIPAKKEGVDLRWIEKIASLEPNNFGDFMSGAFAPVAFFWLAYSVWIQKKELKENRNVMEQQKEALDATATSNEILTKETSHQNNLIQEQITIDILYKYQQILIDLISSTSTISITRDNNSVKPLTQFFIQQGHTRDSRLIFTLKETINQFNSHKWNFKKLSDQPDSGKLLELIEITNRMISLQSSELSTRVSQLNKLYGITEINQNLKEWLID